MKPIIIISITFLLLSCAKIKHNHEKNTSIYVCNSIVHADFPTYRMNIKDDSTVIVIGHQSTLHFVDVDSKRSVTLYDGDLYRCEVEQLTKE